MKPWIWLRISAGLYAFFTLGHSFGFNLAPSRGAAEEALFAAMRAYRFDVQGVTVTHWSAYRGFGHLLTASLVFLAVLSWQLGRLSREHPAAARPIVVTLFGISAAFAVLGWVWFFPAPAATATLATAAVGAAWLALRRA